jgi:hypothetical protein
MGNHFDTLVDLVKRLVSEEETAGSFYQPPLPRTRVRQYLSDIIRRAALFEFPLRAEEVFPQSGKDKAEYDRYLRDYLELSAQHGRFLATPFPITAIEDPVSVVILDPKGDGRYYVTTCLRDDELTHPMLSLNLFDCLLARPQKAFLGISVSLLYDGIAVNDAYHHAPSRTDEAIRDAAHHDGAHAILAYVEELIYVMDPANFIFRKEQSQSARERERAARKRGPRPLLKTVMRPHYTFFDEEQTRRLCHGGPVEPHIVRGHWRTLVSERWVNKRGQRLFIGQYFTGEGHVQKTGGWTYEVMVKEDPTRLVPYSRRGRE